MKKVALFWAFIAGISSWAAAEIIWQTDGSTLTDWIEFSNAVDEAGPSAGGIRVVNYGSDSIIQMNSWWDGAEQTAIQRIIPVQIQPDIIYRCTFSLTSYAGGNPVTLKVMDADNDWQILQTLSVSPSTSSFSDRTISLDTAFFRDAAGHRLAIGLDAGWWNNVGILQIRLEIDHPAGLAVPFSTVLEGQIKSIPEWGADTAWPSTDNMRHCITHMGIENIDVIRLNFYIHEPLDANGQLGADSKAKITNQLNITAMAGSKPLVLTPATGDGVHDWYKNGSQVRPDRWVAAMEATQLYINRPIYAAEPFNEPDYGWNQGTATNLYDILGLLQTSPRFNGTLFGGASVLNSDNAVWWYDQIKTRLAMGTTHQLAGSTTSYINFLQYVRSRGQIPANPEVHSLAEVIYGAEYGLESAIWWGPALLPRGLFVRACQGRRLGYAENRNRFSAAAVYRAPDDNLYGFAGCFERQGSLSPYRLICTDRPVYYNGIGPIREFMLPVTVGQDSFVEIDMDEDADIVPPFDGNRWKIVNRQSGRVMEVASAGLQDGADIREGIDTGALHQRWNIVREKEGYYRLLAAHSGRTAEVADWSVANGANVRQWGTGDNFLQSWFFESAGNGYYYIRNAHSCKYATGNNNIYQWAYTGANNQQWRFILDNPSPGGTLKAHYAFENNTLDSAGSYHGQAFGSPTYIDGPLGQAIRLDGSDDYLVLPGGIASSTDITIAAWVYWNGGAAWQRIFDFGNNTTSYLFLTPRSADGTLRFAITTASNTAEEILETDPLPIGRWTHVAVTLQGNTGILYLNGTARVAGQIRLNPSDINSLYNYIGRSQWPDPLLNGAVDDFRIYSYALSTSQIAQLSSPPFFTGPSFQNTHGVELWPYAGSSLTAFLSPSSVGPFTFQKTSGPQWLEISSNGTLSGIPRNADVGENLFFVQVQNQMNLSDTAVMTIWVDDVYSGASGLDDLSGLADHWLDTDCPDSPACNGADLDNDRAVTLSDFLIFSQNWLSE